MDGIPGDEDFGDGNSGNGDPSDPGDPDDNPPDNEGPDDPHDNPDSSEHNIQNNLADAIAMLARNVWRSKVWEPDPFNRTDLAKLRMFLIQLWLSFNDHPCAFADDHNKVNFTISYLKGIALANFGNSIEPDLLHPLAWDDDYGEFVLELKMYFESLDVVSEAESKLENLLMKPTQRIAKYLIEFNRLATITGWDNHALQHQFYRGLPAHVKDEVSWVGKPITLPALRALAQSIDSCYWEREEETCCECGSSQSSEKKTNKLKSQPSSSNQGNQNKHHNKLFVPHDSGLSSQNSEKKQSNLDNKSGKEGKLTAMERACCFANNLCIFWRMSKILFLRLESQRSRSKGKVRETRDSSGWGLKKIVSSPLDSTRIMGCVDPNCAVTEVHLNASTPFELNTLFLSVTTIWFLPLFWKH